MIYGFSKKTYTSLENAASAAVARIYESGLCFRDGAIGPGGNNVRADAAAQAFTVQDLDLLSRSDNPLDCGFAAIILMRQSFAKLPIDAPDGKVLLRQIYNQVQTLKEKGWTAHNEPPSLTSGFYQANADEGKNAINTDRAQLADLGASWDSLPDTAKGLLPRPRKP